MAGWIESGSKGFTIGGYGTDKGTYADGTPYDITGCWNYATLTVSTNKEKVDYKITISAGGTSTAYIYLYLEIDGQKIINNYYNNGTDEKWNQFPRGNGTSKSGSVTLTDANDTSIPVSMWIGVGRQTPNVKTGYTYSNSLTLTRSKWADVTPGTVSVIDNENNSITLTATPGIAGDNNSISSAELEWTYYLPNTETWAQNGSSYLKEAFTADELKAGKKVKTIKINDLTKTNGSAFDTKDQRRFAFKVNTTGSRGSMQAKDWGSTYGSSLNEQAIKNNEFYINQYREPSNPSNILLRKNKTRLTIKEDWKISWTAAPQTNSISPVAFYRFRLYKKSPTGTKFSPIHIYDSNAADRVPLSTKDNEDIYLDVGNVIEYTFNPAYCDILAKDQVNISVEAYSEDGKNNPLRGGRTFMYTEGSGTTVQNAGVVRVKVSNTGVSTVDWKEGQVWVKVSNTGNNGVDWKEAETVRTKVSNTGNVNTDWKESQ